MATQPQSLENLYSVAEIQKLEQLYARFHDGQTYPLMERAGAAVYTEMRDRWPELTSILVVCGKGNNGGDGFIVARLAALAGLQTTVALMPGADQPEGDAARAFKRLKSSPAQITDYADTLLAQHQVVVDAMLGSGLSDVVRSPIAEAIEAINSAALPVVAVDIPSGLNGDTGAIQGSAVKADLTVCFIGLKRGLVTAKAADTCGELVVNDLKCGSGVFSLVRPKTFAFGYDYGQRLLRPRKKSSHKGHHGHTLIIGGAPSMSGAAKLAAMAAARVGSGKVSILTHAQHADLLNLDQPELMVHSAPESATKESLNYLLAEVDVIVIGPGLGKHNWGRNLVAVLEDFLASKKNLPSVWDADALNILSERPRALANRVFTPHPGEAGRLLETDAKQVQQDRYSAVHQLVDIYQGICVLKGNGTIVSDGLQQYVVDEGNPGMASGGMGDILGGVIAGLIAQGVSLMDAARLGVAVHGRAGELAVTDGVNRYERGLLASDLLPFIRQLANPIYREAD